MTLREAVGLAAQHGGRMNLIIDSTKPGSFIGFVGIQVNTPGDGGFVMDRYGSPHVVSWSSVQSWSLIIETSGVERDRAWVA